MSEQPPYAQYPRPNRMPSGVTPLPPGPHIEAISEAINLFQREWATYVLAALIMFGICGGIYGLLYFCLFATLGFGSHPGASGDAPFLVFPVVALLYIVLALAYLGFYYGIAGMALKQIRGYPIAVSDVFGAFRFTLRLLGTNFLIGLASAVGICLCIVPGLWISGSLSLAPFIAIDQDKGVVDSLSESWRVAGTFGTGIALWGMMFLIGLVGMVGEFACCVGLLATVPISIIAMAVEYFYFFPNAFGVTDFGIPSYGGPPPPQG